MCGIAGIIRLKGHVSSENIGTVTRMRDVLYHRGPDSQGLFHDQHVVLANTRLSIIDTSDNGALPMSSSDGSVWLCYNGEISNFRELRSKHRLEERFPMRSTTDSEVLLYLYKLLGIGFLNELSGMFAFCIVDRQKQEAFIVRDFHGILPLYIWEGADAIHFASEIKSFLEIPGFQRNVDRTAVHHFFSLAYIPGAATPFMGLRELQGGELLHIDLTTGSHSFRDYYHLDYEENHGVTEKQAVETTRELLIDSVKRNLVSDAPLGMTLSGGIDTCSMLGIVKHLGLGHQMNTFSLRMGEKSFDESPYQRLMAQYAGSVHHEITVNPDDVVETMLTQVATWTNPMATGPASLPSSSPDRHRNM